MLKTFLLPLFIGCIITSALKAQHIQVLQQDLKRTDTRGLSVVDDSVAWICGSRAMVTTDGKKPERKAMVAITTDGGKTWTWQLIKGYEKSDFRAVEAFSKENAVIMSSGTPALILKTSDGGKTWHEKYRNADTTYFLDAMQFENPKHGIALGDPIKNKFLLLETTDGAETWRPFKNQPDALPGEAAFAASGTCLRFQDGEIHIVTGGTVARHLSIDVHSKQWYVNELPITHGQASEGAFSIAVKPNWVAVGGDYAKDKVIDSVSCVFDSSIKARFNLSKQGPAGYQSCVEAVGGNSYLSTGTSGSNFSTDGGMTWLKIDDTRYHVCRKAKKGKLVLLTGDGGKIGKLVE